MQVKPRFKNYKIVENYPIEKDDTGNSICLCKLEVTPRTYEDEIPISSYFFWTVMGLNQEVYGNKAVGYHNIAFWKEEKDVLYKGEIEGILIEEVNDGNHFLFQEIGFRTKYNIKLNK